MAKRKPGEAPHLRFEPKKLVSWPAKQEPVLRLTLEKLAAIVQDNDGAGSTQHYHDLEACTMLLSSIVAISAPTLDPELKSQAIKKVAFSAGKDNITTPHLFRLRLASIVFQNSKAEQFEYQVAFPVRCRSTGMRYEFFQGHPLILCSPELSQLRSERFKIDVERALIRAPLGPHLSLFIGKEYAANPVAAANRIEERVELVRAAWNYVHAAFSNIFMELYRPRARFLRVSKVGVWDAESEYVETLNGPGQLRLGRPPEVDPLRLRIAKRIVDELHSNENLLAQHLRSGLLRYQAGLEAANPETSLLCFWQTLEILASGADNTPNSDKLKRRVSVLAGDYELTKHLIPHLAERRNEQVHKGITPELDRQAADTLRLLCEFSIERMRGWLRAKWTWSDVEAEFEAPRSDPRRLKAQRRAIDRELYRLRKKK